MFKNLELQAVYTSDDNDIPREFYNPVLKQAVSFDRTSAYFSAKALAMYAEGLDCFCARGYKYRLIISEDISEDDYNEIKKGYAVRKALVEKMVSTLDEQLTLREERNLSNLAYFISTGTVDIKIAFKEKGIFHDKCGILRDTEGNMICFRGSNNETAAAVNINYESFQVTCSWLDNQGFYLKGILKSQEEFETLWSNKKAGIHVIPAEDVIIKSILKHNKGKIIVEDVLLKANAVVLDYEDRLILQVNTEDLTWLTDKMFFKSRLLHKVEKIVNNTVFFKNDLSYPDFITIDNVLSKKIPPLGHEYYSTQRLKDYIEARNLHIKERASLGIELKTDAARLDERYLAFKKVVDDSLERKLREKQMQDAFFMYAMTKSGNFSVPGSGKTSSALAVFSFLKAKGLAERIVMIGPKNAFGSWIDEFEACFGEKLALRFFNIQDTRYRSASEKKYALKYESASCNLFLFNYESVGTYLEEIKHIVSDKTLLVFDEVHKVKAVNGQRASVALDVAKYASYTIAMTGTPIPNSYLDLYNLLHILYNDEYKDFFGFDISILKDPSPSEVERINDKIQPFFCRTTKKELKVPDANEDIIEKIDVSPEEQQLFEIVSKKYRNNKLALFIRLLQLESNPQLLLNSLDLSEFSSVLDITDDIDEIDIVDYSIEVKRLIDAMGITSKKRACVHLIKELVNQKKRVVVWCIFKDSIRSITEILNRMGIKAQYVMGEVELDERNQLIDAYRKGKFDVLVTNPHTLAESVSLHSICHDAVYFEYSYNLVHLLQSKDRIHRLGLAQEQYTQYYFIQDWFLKDGDLFSIDERVYKRLLEKEKVMLDAIDNHELEPVYTAEEDLELIFGSIL